MCWKSELLQNISHPSFFALKRNYNLLIPKKKKSHTHIHINVQYVLYLLQTSLTGNLFSIENAPKCDLLRKKI